MTSSCWYQSRWSPRGDFIRRTGKPQYSRVQRGPLIFYATPYLVPTRSVWRFHIMVQAVVRSRNIAKSMAQMSRCPSNSPESVFPKSQQQLWMSMHSIPQSILDALQSVLDAMEPFPTPLPSSQPVLERHRYLQDPDLTASLKKLKDWKEYQVYFQRGIDRLKRGMEGARRAVETIERKDPGVDCSTGLGKFHGLHHKGWLRTIERQREKLAPE